MTAATHPSGDRAGPRRKQRVLALALSLLAHAAVLSALCTLALRQAFRPFPGEPVELRLASPPALPIYVPQPSRPAARAAARPAARTRFAKRRAPTRAAAQQVVPAVPGPPAPAPAAPATQPAVGSAPGTGVDDRIRAALRAGLGCSHPQFLGLSPADVARCQHKLGEEAKRVVVPVDPIPAEKRAYYDAVAAAYAHIRQSSPTLVGVGGQAKWYGHPPGLTCKVGFGGGSKSAKPPHSLKLGPLPCYITPPQGVLTEEADIPPPY